MTYTPTPTPYRLTRDDLIEHLREQLVFLRDDAAGFDSGNPAEAKRLALCLRLLLHDAGGSKSLLGQLGELQSLEFLDTANEFEPSAHSQSPCLLGMKNVPPIGIVFVPFVQLDSPRGDRRRPFGEWWDQQVVAADMAQHTFTRRDFVLNLADKEGGAHVDPELPPTYAELVRRNSLGWVRMKEDDERSREPMGSPVAASVRQIAHEVVETLRSLPYLADMY